MNLTGNLVNAYYICHRKLWYFSRQLNPEKTFELLEIGRLYSEDSYIREKKELTILNMKIDIIKREGNNILVGEIKKSSVGIKAAQMQLLFYLYEFKKQGLFLKGEVLIPKERKRFVFELTNEFEREIESVISEIEKIISSEQPPLKVKTKFCTKCSFREFCWS